MEKFLKTIVSLVMANVSPFLRESVTEWVKDAEARAKETPNPWDDMFVAMIKVVLGV